MSQDLSPYDAVIADLESRIQHLQVMLEGLKQLRSPVAGAPVLAAQSSRTTNETEILHDSFFGMTIGDAAKKYLNMTKATKSTSEIGSALERGGLKHSSKDFNTTVRSVLGGRDDFLRVNGDWGLTEWYPGLRREKKTKQKPIEDIGVPVANVTPVQDFPSDPIPKTTRTTVNIAPGSIKDKIVQLVSADPARIFKAPELAEKIGVGIPSTQAALSELFKVGLVDRPGNGEYRAKATAA